MRNGEVSGKVRADEIVACLVSKRQFCLFVMSYVRADKIRDLTVVTTPVSSHYNIHVILGAGLNPMHVQ